MENFQIYGVQVTGKCICNSKKKKQKVMLPGKNVTQALDITPLPREKEITYPQGSTFFKKFPQEKGGGRNYVNIGQEMMY